MRILGLVTARGGSKGFPRKNIAHLAGRPLVAWAHHALSGLRSKHPELVLRLSTDDPAIAAAWPEADRPADLRPSHLATDEATSWSVIEYELDRAAAAGEPLDGVLLLQPTSPLITAEDLEALWQRFMGGAASVIGVTPLDHPIHWSQHLDDDGILTPALPDASDARRQNLRVAHRPVGCYIASSAFLREHRAFAVPSRTRGVVVPASRAVDVDHAVDLDIARIHLARSSREHAFTLGGKRIGAGAPCFIIAEAGVNHNGDPDLARRLIHAAARAGADAVKFQTFSADRLVTRQARKAAYQSANTGGQESQYEMLKRLELPTKALADLKRETDSLGLVFLSSPFDPQSVQELLDLGVEGFKLGSGELTTPAMIEALAAAQKPLILSTGMCTLDEVEEVALHLKRLGDPPVAWLHCVSSYPAPPEHANLRAMESLRLAVGGPVGMSDHSMGWEVSIAAVALGACLLEKHLTLSRAMPGPDHTASLEPDELTAMVAQIRRVESAMGDGVKRPMPSELDTRQVARKSVVAARSLAPGATLREEDLVIKRPGSGIEPRAMPAIVGRVLVRAVEADEPITWEHLR
jgi:N,N'-diacetyllegionaminate synthase